jgi:hypothetical protein
VRIIGGPRDGQIISITETSGGPELQIEGMILEYSFTEPGKVNIRFFAEPNPKPSFPGLVERYKCQNGAWYYIAPPGGDGVRATPPSPME